jgi:Stress responsive A/B Barrel Domain
MLKHIVFFRFLKDDEEIFEELMEATSLQLMDLTTLSCIESLTIHRNLEHSPYANFDLMIDCSFKNFDQLKKYQEHPKHMAFVSWLKMVITERACVDFEV